MVCNQSCDTVGPHSSFGVPSFVQTSEVMKV